MIFNIKDNLKNYTVEFAVLRSGEIVFDNEEQINLTCYVQLEDMGFVTLPYLVIEDQNGKEIARHNLLDIKSFVWYDQEDPVEETPKKRGRKPKGSK